MSALSQNNPVVDKSQAPAQAGGQAPAFRIDMGAHALALTAVTAMMGLYNRIMALYQEQKAASVQMQAKESLGASTAERKAGEEAKFWGMISAGATAGGAVSGALATALASSGAGTYARSEMKEIGLEKRVTDRIQENMKLAPAKLNSEGKLPDDIDLSAKDSFGEDIHLTYKEVEGRFEELRDGNFTNAKDKTELEDEKWYDKWNPLKSEERQKNIRKENDKNNKLTELAVPYVNAFKKENNEIAEFNQTLKDRQNQHALNLNTTAQDFNNAVQVRTSFANIVGQVGNATSGATNATGQAKQANERAKQTLFNTAQQMAGASASEFTQGAGKAESAEREAVQSLSVMDQNNGNQG